MQQALTDACRGRVRAPGNRCEYDLKRMDARDFCTLCGPDAIFAVRVSYSCCSMHGLDCTAVNVKQKILQESIIWLLIIRLKYNSLFQLHIIIITTLMTLDLMKLTH